MPGYGPKQYGMSMIPESERRRIVDLMRREVVPAIGCTEPIAVSPLHGPHPRNCWMRNRNESGCC